MNLTGKTAVVTGAGSGIGAGICQVLFRHGANVALIDIDESRCQKIADELPENDGRTSVHKADVRSVEDIQNVANEVINFWGKVPSNLDVPPCPCRKSLQPLSERHLRLKRLWLFAWLKIYCQT